MIKFIMALAMAALIGSAVIAGLNNKKLNEEKDNILRLNNELADLNSDLDQAKQNLETAKAELANAEAANQKVKAELSLANDDLTRKTGETERLTAQFDSKRAQLDEFALLEKSLGGRTPEMVKAEYDGLVQRKDNKEQELRDVQNQVVDTQQQVEKNRAKITQLVADEEERRKKVALNGLEATVIAVNRDYGFVIVNAGSDLGVAADSSLLVQRGVDRIGRLRIVSVEPKVTVADIIPGTITPGAQIMVRDKVIFENVR